jgi:hypothetical protein
MNPPRPVVALVRHGLLQRGRRFVKVFYNDAPANPFSSKIASISRRAPPRLKRHKIPPKT